jgi:hypothetical protein
MKTHKQNFLSAMMVANQLKVEKDKLGINCGIFVESNESTLKVIQREMKKIQVKHCITDKHGAIVYDEKGNFTFGKDKIFDLEDELDVLLSEEIELEPCVTSVQECKRVEESGLINATNFCGILIP